MEHSHKKSARGNDVALIFCIGIASIMGGYLSIEYSDSLRNVTRELDRVKQEHRRSSFVKDHAISIRDQQIKDLWASNNFLSSQLSAAYARTTVVIPPSYSQNDYILSRKEWRCEQYGSKFRWSKAEADPDSNIKNFWLGKSRVCFKFVRLGAI